MDGKVMQKVLCPLCDTDVSKVAPNRDGLRSCYVCATWFPARWALALADLEKHKRKK